MTDFERAIYLLCDTDVDFVIIGGVSASLHGSAYITRDLDIWFERSRSNVKRLADALAAVHPRPAGFPADLPFVFDPAALNNSTILTLETDIGAIDLLGEVAGAGSYAEAKADAVVKEAFGKRVPILNLRRLIASKRAIGRAKDLLLIPELEALLEATQK